MWNSENCLQKREDAHPRTTTKDNDNAKDNDQGNNLHIHVIDDLAVKGEDINKDNDDNVENIKDDEDNDDDDDDDNDHGNCAIFVGIYIAS